MIGLSVFQKPRCTNDTNGANETYFVMERSI